MHDDDDDDDDGGRDLRPSGLAACSHGVWRLAY
jgi:hypothetical protein